MKAKYHIPYILLCLLLLVGCTSEGIALGTSTDDGEGEMPQIQVELNFAIPANELPSARSINDDSAIQTVTIWAFNEEEKFAYQVSDEKVSINNNKLYVLLPEGETVTLAAIVNATVTEEPPSGTPKAEALRKLTYSIKDKQPDNMPMYGECTLNQVAAGSKGTLSLKRAMAKIVVDASAVKGLLDLTQVKLIQVNQDGYITSGVFPNNTETLEFSVTNNQLTVYIPEIQNTFADNSRVSILLKGKYDGADSFYRLDFLSNGKQVKSIERNYAYIFKIENVTSSGYSGEEEALAAEKASNDLGGTSEVDLLIADESIMDITTDGEYYLGVTSASIEAGKNAYGYFANFSVVSNNNKAGWEIKELPDGITASVSKGKGDGKATSIWIYIDTNASQVKEEKVLNVFVYSGGIRKRIEIIIKD